MGKSFSVHEKVHARNGNGASLNGASVGAVEKDREGQDETPRAVSPAVPDKTILGAPIVPILPDASFGGDKVLRVLKTDLKLKENGAEHRTDKFDIMTRETRANLVVRRGQDFTLEIFFNRPFVKEKDGASLLFSVQDGKPSRNHGTLVAVPLIDKLERPSSPNGWYAYIKEEKGASVTIQIKTASNCSAGKWNIVVDTRLRSNPSGLTYTLPNPIWMLFNPWNSDDEVFLAADDARQEYVLEDSGLIWTGSHNRLRPIPWAYSQFEPDVLECGLSLLDKLLKPSMRGDAVKAVRALSALVNSNDDGGVLSGNWSGDYAGGVSPTEWTGSAKIIRQYHETRKPVKFGQCWVFAGVLTTICRAIGIPCRPVTNFSSAHDTQSSLTIDRVVDAEGKKVEEFNSDSIWNFHVWCEVWMKREDLGDDMYTGWQAIDATPQELSEGVFRMGPASVEACRRGEVKRGYDVDFLFSEVNADEVYWKYLGPSQPLKLLSRKPNTESIGLNISTKAIGKFAREDVTLNYKHPERSTKEREVMFKALKQNGSLFSRYYLNEKFNDVRFDFELIDDITIGSSFRVQLRMKNVNTTKAFDVKGFLRVDSQLYTGKLKDVVMKRDFQKKILPLTSEEITCRVTYEEYAKALTPEGAFNVACLASVDQTQFEYFAQDDFRVRKPDIKITIPKDTKIRVGQPFDATALLHNPLPVPLHKCCFSVEAPSLTQPISIQLQKPVMPGGIASGKFVITPQQSGQRTITAKWKSTELQDVDGYLVVNVYSTQLF